MENGSRPGAANTTTRWRDDPAPGLPPPAPAHQEFRQVGPRPSEYCANCRRRGAISSEGGRRGGTSGTGRGHFSVSHESPRRAGHVPLSGPHRRPGAPPVRSSPGHTASRMDSSIGNALMPAACSTIAGRANWTGTSVRWTCIAGNGGQPRQTSNRSRMGPTIGLSPRNGPRPPDAGASLARPPATIGKGPQTIDFRASVTPISFGALYIRPAPPGAARAPSHRIRLHFPDDVLRRVSA